jgi:hypothetical protein
VNQHRAVGFTVAVATATALLVLTLGLVLPRPLEQVFDELRGYPAWSRRAGLSPEAPPFGRGRLTGRLRTIHANQNRNPEA